MQVSGTPLKFLIPFAANDVNKVEIPTTTASPGRASQSLGFPPLTMQPPESGGLPPQGEDFNGAMNQIARVAWWMMAGGAFPFDSAFAAGVSPAGYPQGSCIRSADLLGNWISTVDNNSSNPDTVAASSTWVPGYAYGNTVVAGLTNANVTLTAAQAAKTLINCTGTLTGNVQIIFPTWLKEWTVLNNTTGAFTITAKTPAGAGIVIPQNTAPTPIRGDGTNITQVAPNIGLSTVANQATRYDQVFTLGQVMTSVVGSRVLGTTYTNSTGKAIFVEVQVSLASGATLSITKGGVIAQTYGNAVAGSVQFSINSIVLPGQSYIVSVSASPSLVAWNEIR